MFAADAKQNYVDEEKTAVLENTIRKLYGSWEENCIMEEVALRPDLIGMRIFEEPLVGISDAADPLYPGLKQMHVVGPWHKLPADWLPDAASVISLFFPFTEQVKAAQRTDTEETSAEWLHARIEGQEAMLIFVKKLGRLIQESGRAAVVPALSSE
ncbi:MAG: hypothetical protein J5973_01655 [Eubacterium sp.]|nr:hypothetical protein [Eubacterium sp.]